MARSTSVSSVSSALSFNQLVEAMLSQCENDAQVLADKINDALPEVLSLIQQKEHLSQVSETRFKALIVSFFRKNKNLGVPSDVLAKTVVREYLKTYEAGDLDKYDVIAERLETFLDQNTGSKKRDNSILKGDSKYKNLMENSFLNSHGPSGTNLRDFESLWSKDSCKAFLALMSELESVNNPVSDDESDDSVSDESDDSESDDSDSDSELK